MAQGGAPKKTAADAEGANDRHEGSGHGGT